MIFINEILKVNRFQYYKENVQIFQPSQSL